MFGLNRKPAHARLNAEELGELKALNGLIKAERYKLLQVHNHPKVVLDSKRWLKVQQGVIDALEAASAELITEFAKRHGVPPGTVVVDLRSAEVWNQKLQNE